MTIMKVFLSLMIEVSSFLDLCTDLFIVWALAKSTDSVWFTISIFTILAPYYTIYGSLINNNIKYVRSFQVKKSCCAVFVICLTNLPTMLAILIAVDIFYMCLSMVAYPILLLFSLCKVGQLFLDKYEKIQSAINKKLFGISFMEFKGFRA